MNIKSATIYMKHGYKIRRSDWESKRSIYGNILGVVEEFQSSHYIMDGNTLTKYLGESWNDNYAFTLDDLIADDWEIVKDEK